MIEEHAQTPAMLQKGAQRLVSAIRLRKLGVLSLGLREQLIDLPLQAAVRLAERR